jgi:hypothetical protein
MTTQILTAKCCSNCAAKFFDGNHLVCRLHPPQVTPIIANRGPHAAPQVVGSVSNFPVIQPDWVCLDHKPGLAFNAMELAASEVKGG